MSISAKEPYKIILSGGIGYGRTYMTCLNIVKAFIDTQPGATLEWPLLRSEQIENIRPILESTMMKRKLEFTWDNPYTLCANNRTLYFITIEKDSHESQNLPSVV